MRHDSPEANASPASCLPLEPRRLLSGGLGYGEASAIGTFGSMFSGGGTIITYTRYGDANLDGVVNLSDFNALIGGGSNAAPLTFSVTRGGTLMITGTKFADRIVVDSDTLARESARPIAMRRSGAFTSTPARGTTSSR